MSKKRLFVCTTLAVLATQALATDANGDDLSVVPSPNPTTPLAGFLRLRSDSSVVTDGGSNLRLPPGYFLDDANWLRLDNEVRRLQEREIRLDAENKSLRASAGSWQPGWKTVLGTLVVGVAGGWYLSTKLD